MKRLCSIDLDGANLDYLLDIGRRSNAYLNVKDGVVTVRLPLGGTKSDADRLILSHRDWLQSKLNAQSDRSRLPQSFENGENFSLLGQQCSLSIVESAEYKEPQLSDGVLTVYTGRGMTRADAERLFLRYINDLCEKRVRQAFDEYSPRLGLTPRRVTLKRMTSRWGSCSSNGNISINVGVICFEQECIDYVVIHELCHLKHMDHGEDFWRLVSTCCPDYKRLRDRMKH